MWIVKAAEPFFIYAHVNAMHTFLFALIIYLYEAEKSLQPESLHFSCSGDFTKDQMLNHDENKVGKHLN